MVGNPLVAAGLFVGIMGASIVNECLTGKDLLNSLGVVIGVIAAFLLLWSAYELGYSAGLARLRHG